MTQFYCISLVITLITHQQIQTTHIYTAERADIRIYIHQQAFCLLLREWIIVQRG